MTVALVLFGAFFLITTVAFVVGMLWPTQAPRRANVRKNADDVRTHAETPMPMVSVALSEELLATSGVLAEWLKQNAGEGGTAIAIVERKELRDALVALRATDIEMPEPSTERLPLSALLRDLASVGE